jgi:hypothetical protein
MAEKPSGGGVDGLSDRRSPWPRYREQTGPDAGSGPGEARLIDTRQLEEYQGYDENRNMRPFVRVAGWPESLGFAAPREVRPVGAAVRH